jgi:hypothetical protein
LVGRGNRLESTAACSTASAAVSTPFSVSATASLPVSVPEAVCSGVWRGGSCRGGRGAGVAFSGGGRLCGSPKPGGSRDSGRRS